MHYNISELLQDNAEFIFYKTLLATQLISDKAWASARSCLASNYKFSVDKDSFAAELTKDVVVLPAAPAFSKNSAKELELFVRYDFVNGQDAAIREVLMSNKLGWTDHFSSSLSPNLKHRFASVVKPTILTGVIVIDLPVTPKLISQWNELHKYSIKSKSMKDYLLKVKEVSNEQG